jgi:hypothetical protein
MGIYRTGYFSGMLAFFFTTAFVVIQILQIMQLIAYPLDEILIYGSSLCIVIPFLFEILALHYVVAPEKKFWTHAAILFSVLYAVFVTANYATQLATVIPLTLRGLSTEIDVLAQTPHSMFWNFDAVGYIAMGFSTLCAALSLSNNGMQRVTRFILILHASVTPLIAFVYFYPSFSNNLLLLGLPWGISAPAAMLSLAILFQKMERV